MNIMKNTMNTKSRVIANVKNTVRAWVRAHYVAGAPIPEGWDRIMREAAEEINFEAENPDWWKSLFDA